MLKKTDTLKIASVDIPLLLAHSKEVADLKQEQNVKNLELQSWANAANAEAEKQKDANKKIEVIQKAQAELNQRRQTLAADYQQKLQKIDVKLTEIITNQAQEMGYNFAFAKGTVLYGATDITADVIKNLK